MAYMVGSMPVHSSSTARFSLVGNDLSLLRYSVRIHCHRNYLVRLFGRHLILLSNEIRFHLVHRRHLRHLIGTDGFWHCVYFHLFEGNWNG